MTTRFLFVFFFVTCTVKIVNGVSQKEAIGAVQALPDWTSEPLNLHPTPTAFRGP